MLSSFKILMFFCSLQCSPILTAEPSQKFIVFPGNIPGRECDTLGFPQTSLHACLQYCLEKPECVVAWFHYGDMRCSWCYYGSTFWIYLGGGDAVAMKVSLNSVKTNACPSKPAVFSPTLNTLFAQNTMLLNGNTKNYRVYYKLDDSKVAGWFYQFDPL